MNSLKFNELVYTDTVNVCFPQVFCPQRATNISLMIGQCIAELGGHFLPILLPLFLLVPFNSIPINPSESAAAKSLQSCPTLCDPIDGSPPGSPVPGILQARTLEWVAISFSNAWKWKVKGKSLSCVRLSATPWTTAHQAPPSMGFSRQVYWSGVPLPSPTIRTTLA